METESKSLGEALPKECARVRGLLVIYRDPELKGAGELAARMMEASLKAADKAMIEGDLVAMIRAYKDLQEYST